MQLDDLERLERTTFEMVVQAMLDYRQQAVQIFREEKDKAQDIAEDVMREAVEAMGVSGFQERLYGKVDYKKAMYVFVPEARPVALMLDAKAEKGNGSATIQMSQTSMRARYVDSKGEHVNEAGKLLQTIERNGRTLHVVSIVCKFVYDEPSTDMYELAEIVLACIPNGALQERYNPNAEDSIWRAGRHAPTLGEDFRVRVHFGKLAEKSAWRVRHIPANDPNE